VTPVSALSTAHIGITIPLIRSITDFSITSVGVGGGRVFPFCGMKHHLSILVRQGKAQTHNTLLQETITRCRISHKLLINHTIMGFGQYIYSMGWNLKTQGSEDPNCQYAMLLFADLLSLRTSCYTFSAFNPVYVTFSRVCHLSQSSKSDPQASSLDECSIG